MDMDLGGIKHNQY